MSVSLAPPMGDWSQRASASLNLEDSPGIAISVACVYNGCMDAASVPSGFITTREYSASQGVALNSASRALKRMAEAGVAVKVGAANWILVDKQDGLSKLL